MFLRSFVVVSFKEPFCISFVELLNLEITIRKGKKKNTSETSY